MRVWKGGGAAGGTEEDPFRGSADTAYFDMMGNEWALVEEKGRSTVSWRVMGSSSAYFDMMGA